MFLLIALFVTIVSGKYFRPSDPPQCTNAHCNSVLDCSGTSVFCQCVNNACTQRLNKEPGCLCVFDIDRTLTGLQNDTKDCPNNLFEPKIPDCAYDGGSLSLSPLAQNIDKTFCSKCFIGVVSAGVACGDNSPERRELIKHLNVSGGLLTDKWSPPGQVLTPLVTSYQDGKKQVAVKEIVDWYSDRGHSIADVHMFDDRVSNIKPFKGTGFSAHQISCQTRDQSHNNEIGLCGATLDEIKPTKGIHIC